MRWEHGDQAEPVKFIVQILWRSTVGLWSDQLIAARDPLGARRSCSEGGKGED